MRDSIEISCIIPKVPTKDTYSSKYHQSSNTGLYPIGSLVEPFAKMVLGHISLNNEEIQKVYETLGFNLAPTIEIPVAESISNSELEQFHVSPLQIALASAALSNHGTIPAPVIATAVNTPNGGWVVLSAEGMPLEAVQPSTAEEAAQSLVKDGEGFWSYGSQAREKDATVAWFIAGTPPDWQGSPMVVVVLLEESNVFLAERIGEELLASAMTP